MFCTSIGQYTYPRIRVFKKLNWTYIGRLVWMYNNRVLTINNFSINTQVV